MKDGSCPEIKLFIPAGNYVTQSHQEFVNLHYVPLAKSYIDQVHIDIKDEIGRSVPFVGGKTLVKLHFKRIKS